MTRMLIVIPTWLERPHLFPLDSDAPPPFPNKKDVLRVTSTSHRQFSLLRVRSWVRQCGFSSNITYLQKTRTKP